MKYRITVSNETYEVEIHDLNARPILATIGDERFLVMPESVAQTLQAAAKPAEKQPSDGIPFVAPTAPVSGDALRAPIPGVIVALSVNAGDEVHVGQEVCVLEAMKMRSPIRAARAGVIAKVCVTVGQQVKQKDVLVEWQ